MKINYRLEIQGLRAIAVSSIILYHAQIKLFDYKIFKGGFLGVDIFFVISGYLITSIILSELFSTGSFSFKRFYKSRARRILPALLFVVIVSIPLAWIYLVPNLLIDYAKSLLFSLGFSSNFYFYFSGQIYGAIDGFLKPFLHTWSLSVEEQFYIIFPIILFCVYRHFNKKIFFFILLIFSISLIVFILGNSKFYPNQSIRSATFYLLFTRMWELMAGSILAYFQIKLGHKNHNNILNFLLPKIGLILIIYSIFFIPNHSYQTIIPVIGTGLIIWFAHENETITKILSIKLFVLIGAISYSLYLWHYPFFVFSKLIIPEINLFVKIFIGLLIILISIFSYVFIEQPARNKKINFKILLLPIISLVLIICMINLNIIKKNGYKERFFFSETYDLNNYKHKQDTHIFETNYNYDDYNNRKNVLIAGNSHGEDILKILSKTKLNNKIYFNLISMQKRDKDYQFQLTELYSFLDSGKQINKLDGYNGDFYRHLKKQFDKSELLILSTQYSQKDLEFLDNLIKLIKLDNKKIILFNNALEQSKGILKLNILDAFVYKNKRFPNQSELIKIETEMFNDIKNTEKINHKIKEIAKKNNILLIDRNNIFCDIEKKTCPSITEDGYKIYWDYGHITNEGAKFFSKKIEKNKLFLDYLKKSLKLTDIH